MSDKTMLTSVQEEYDQMVADTERRIAKNQLLRGLWFCPLVYPLWLIVFTILQMLLFVIMMIHDYR